MKIISYLATIVAVLSLITAFYTKLANTILANTSAGGFLGLSTTCILFAIAFMLYAKES